MFSGLLKGQHGVKQRLRGLAASFGHSQYFLLQFAPPKTKKDVTFGGVHPGSDLVLVEILLFFTKLHPGCSCRSEPLSHQSCLRTLWGGARKVEVTSTL